MNRMNQTAECIVLWQRDSECKIVIAKKVLAERERFCLFLSFFPINDMCINPSSFFLNSLQLTNPIEDISAHWEAEINIGEERSRRECESEEMKQRWRNCV